jgi:hypothetical protein
MPLDPMFAGSYPAEAINFYSKSKVKQSLYTPWRRLGGRGGGEEEEESIAPTHSRPRH